MPPNHPCSACGVNFVRYFEARRCWLVFLTCSRTQIYCNPACVILTAEFVAPVPVSVPK